MERLVQYNLYKKIKNHNKIIYQVYNSLLQYYIQSDKVY